MGFDGALFDAIEAYKRDRLADVNELRQRLCFTSELGDILTRDTVSRNRAIFESIGPRETALEFDPLFLTFLQHPEWIGSTDRQLVALRDRLRHTPTVWRHFKGELAEQPLARLFELNLVSSLAAEFPDVVAFPRLRGPQQRADAKISLGSTDVFVEGAVLHESRGSIQLRALMHRQRRHRWVGSTDVASESMRVLRKLDHEARQTSEESPNMLLLSLYMSELPVEFHRWEIEQWFLGKSTLVTTDSALVHRIDCVILFGRRRYVATIINEVAGQRHQLSQDQRAKVVDLLERASFMIR